MAVDVFESIRVCQNANAENSLLERVGNDVFCGPKITLIRKKISSKFREYFSDKSITYLSPLSLDILGLLSIFFCIPGLLCIFPVMLRVDRESQSPSVSLEPHSDGSK